MENKKKMNPYMKAAVIILFASILGSVIGFTQAFFDEGISGLLQSIGLWIASNSVLLFLCVFVIGILCGIFWYVKAASVEMKIESLDDREEEQIDRLDYRFNVNVNLGMLVSNVALILGMVFMGTAFGYGIPRERRLIVAVGLLLMTVCMMMYQVALVRLIRKKDPTKQGDASDLHFQKIYLASCDEAEKAIVYRAGYKTMNFSQIVIMIILVIALLGQIAYGTGMLAVVLTAVTYVLMQVHYIVHCIWLSKSKLNN